VQDNSSEALARTKDAYDEFLADRNNLNLVREQLKVWSGGLDFGGGVVIEVGLCVK
jgi:hypothetical protein